MYYYIYNINKKYMYRCHNEFCKCYAVTLPNTPSAVSFPE